MGVYGTYNEAGEGDDCPDEGMSYFDALRIHPLSTDSSRKIIPKLCGCLKAVQLKATLYDCKVRQGEEEPFMPQVRFDVCLG
jgi:hypothetical protein